MQAVITKKNIRLSEVSRIKGLLKGLNVNTVCEEARCPNLSECSREKKRTFLILGKTCTRNCSFCNIEFGIPEAANKNEITQITEAVKRLGLNHVIITSPTRDDLADGGAFAFSSAVNKIRSIDFVNRIELLIPDLKGSNISLHKIIESKPDIIGHNIETVKRLYHLRNKASYRRSLEILKIIKKTNSNIVVKTALILGMGENMMEIDQTLKDISCTGCDEIHIGQYIAPSKKHDTVKKYYTDKEFEEIEKKALLRGFSKVLCGTYVRSSFG